MRAAWLRSPVTVIATMGLLAFVVRAHTWLQPGSLLTEREYDDGVMFAASIATLLGKTPYGDFVYLHPPGSFVVLMPFAALAGPLTDAQSLAIARVAFALIGVANTVLVGVLLRPVGRLAILAGAGAYAVWSNVVRSEETVLLEPILNLLLLIALVCLARRRLGLVFVAGAVLGIALTVKYWAVVDIVVVGAMIAILWGWRGLWRYLMSGVIAVLAVMLPFFVQAPQAMWAQTVLAQLGRPRSVSGAGPSVWGRHVSPIAGQHILDFLVPGLVWAGLFAVVVLAVAIALLRRPLRSWRRPSRWPDSAWWTILLLAHFAALLLTGKAFYYHYAAWIIAPLTLCLGALTIGIRRARARRVAAVVVGAAVVAVGVGDLIRPTLPSGSPTELAQAASGFECTWGTPSQLILADRLTAAVTAGCAIDIDPFGVALTQFREGAGKTDAPQWNQLWLDHAWEQITAADAVILPADADASFFTAEQAGELEDGRSVVYEDDRVVVWGRP
ncbi:hypothetical protein ET445_12455 [Agromyces protaetiae]|uniref:Glycosyltransferase RgtA/B/C/D-like domain-containing protein n=1 Tax=Agromyces protaetiae TaxID=2509455 RepID=A0A4P6FCK3_9MICO|nr:hypothetical protein [Agromyces protaetiae]QAY74030.1 hypothetical protein ET445_12455 [Agromyces protaetiae]